jgi:plastocyanin domain-containing protein
MNKTAIIILVSSVLIAGALIAAGISTNKARPPENNVSIVEGVQIVDLRARGGYQPRKSVAKAGVPTIIRFTTNGTFDCSTAVRIPSLNIARTLQTKGTTEIEIGAQQAGLLRGSCGMGMYPFEIEFTS